MRWLGARRGAPPLPDHGVFVAYVDGDRVGTVRFRRGADGAYEGTYTLRVAGQRTASGLTVRPDARGRWAEAELRSALGTVRMTRRRGGVGVDADGRRTTVRATGRSLLQHATAPALVADAVRAYDPRAGGTQSLPIVAAPGVAATLRLTREGAVDRGPGARPRRVWRYRYELPSGEAVVWAEEDGRVHVVSSAAHRGAFVRASSASWARALAGESAEARRVRVRRGVRVPMRDGVELSTDLYLPARAGAAPAVLIRTPYKKEMEEVQARFLARRGYGVAVQDVRGRFASPGRWEPFVHERRDGHDAVEWLAAQPWCTGRVGMVGGSYLAYCQWAAAASGAPHLVTIVPVAAPTDPFLNIPYEHGVFHALGAIWWLEVVERGASADISGAQLAALARRRYDELLRPMPLRSRDVAIFGAANPHWRRWIDHPTADAYWRRAGFLDRLARARLPVFHQTGWFDGSSVGAKLNYLRMVEHGHPHQKLVVGPWGHFAESRVAAGRDFGPSAIYDLERATLRWLDRWLKDGGDGAEDDAPLVELFVMGANRWLRADAYPLPTTRWERWYLAPRALLARAGRLSRTPPPAGAAPGRFRYDPDDPTPDVTADGTPAYPRAGRGRARDVLAYASRPLRHPLTIAGPVSMVLHAATSAADTDWHVRLLQVDRAGTLVLAHGRVRARFRDSASRPTPVAPGRVHRYAIDMWHTATRVPAGARLVVHVASAAYPTYSRNTNTGGHSEAESDGVVAEQQVSHEGAAPSYVVLPVIPDQP